MEQSKIPNALLSEHEVAAIVGLSLGTIRRWRIQRQGPRFLKIGAAVRYRREDLAAWIESRPAGGERSAA